MEESSTLWEKLMHNFSEENENQDDVEKEILLLVQEGRERGFFAGSEGEMISNIFSYSEKEAKDIMTHRKHIIGIDGNKTMEEVINFIVNQRISRFPVYDGDIDSIVGILHLRDAMKCYFTEDLRNVPIKNLKGHVRPVKFVPETKSIDKLLKDMKQKKNHMVVVLDEYGLTQGIVAMEDIIEEIVGNIQDEYDNEEELIKKQEDGSYIAHGMAEVEDIEKLLQVEVDNENFGTLNGYLVHRLDHIPSEDEKCEVKCKGYLFTVTSVRNNMIEYVEIRQI